MARLTREESKARTRSRLMEAAGKVFACRGLERATVDDVAGEAGYTKGAFYANFESKEALFLAMLDQRFADRLAEIDRVLDSGAPVAEQARMAGQEFSDYLAGDPEWSRLFLEFAARALRDERFRGELVARQRALRERIAAGFEDHVAALGGRPPVPSAQVAAMVYAMGDGFALARQLDPEGVPADLFATMLAVFFTGMEALTQASVARSGA